MKIMKTNFDMVLPQKLDKKYEAELFRHCDSEARKKLILHNVRLVIYIIFSKYSNIPCDLDDLISIGTIGLIRAVDTFNIDKGIAFATYATRCIENQIRMFLRANYKTFEDVSLNEPLSESSNLTLEDQLTVNSLSTETFYERKCDLKRIREILLSMPKDRRKLIVSYFGLGREKTSQTELAKMYGVDKSTINKKIKRILSEIKNALEEPLKKI